MASPVVEFEKVALARDQGRLFKGLTFTLDAGQTALIEGGNLSGKSSLLRALQRDPADCPELTGNIRFQGRQMRELPTPLYRELLAAWGFVPEDAASMLFPRNRVRRQLKSAGRYSDDALVEQLRSMGFGDPDRVLSLRVEQLSYGSRLAVAVLYQLLRRPSVLVIDDVFLARDALGTDQWLAELKRRQRSDAFCTVVLCRSRSDYASLTPDVVVQLSAARTLSAPSARDLSAVASPPRKKPAPSKPLLRVEHLSCLMSLGGGWLSTPHDVLALRGVSFDLLPGQCLALVGASPSGKSTLAMTLARLLEPTLGRVSLRAAKLDRQLERSARRMLVCFDDARGSLDLRLRVEQLLQEALVARRATGSELAKSALRAVGLDASLLGRTAAQLSSSELQLLALSRVLIFDPAVLILDNSVSSLSASHKRQLMRLLREHRAERAQSTVIISHDIRAVSKDTDQLAVMYAGRVVEMGRTDEVMQGRHHPYTRVLLGSRPERSQNLQLVIEGGTPEQSRLPQGCPFHPRCPRAEAGRCDSTDPDLLPMAESGGHLVACWHPFV